MARGVLGLLVFMVTVYHDRLPILAGATGAFICAAGARRHAAAGWSTLPGLLINIVFACLFLGHPLPCVRELWGRRAQRAYGQVVAWGQYVVGVGLVLVLLGPMFGADCGPAWPFRCWPSRAACPFFLIACAAVAMWLTIVFLPRAIRRVRAPAGPIAQPDARKNGPQGAVGA